MPCLQYTQYSARKGRHHSIVQNGARKGAPASVLAAKKRSHVITAAPMGTSAAREGNFL